TGACIVGWIRGQALRLPAVGRDREDIRLPFGTRMEDQPLIVRRPACWPDQRAVKGCQSRRIRTVGIRNPDFFGSGPSPIVGDFFPLRRIPGREITACRRDENPRLPRLTSRWRDFGAPDVYVTCEPGVNEMASQTYPLDHSFQRYDSFRFAG